MDRCAACGAALQPGAGWCGQCYAATTNAPAATSPSAAPFAATPFAAAPAALGPVATVPTRVGLPAAPTLPPPPARRTRWGKTPTTFGPVGRLGATVALLVPLGPLVVGGLADPFIWGGIAAYGGILMPWALRDIWKAGQVSTR